MEVMERDGSGEEWEQWVGANPHQRYLNFLPL